MDWQDEGVILSMRPHGESAAIIEVFTRGHGRHAGVVRGGASRRMAAHVQPGTQVAATWRARLTDHIGAFTLEPVQSRAHLMESRVALAGLSSVLALLRVALPERQPHAALWDQTMALLAGLGRDAGWPGDYLRWEMRLLADLGFGLDLSSCALTGATTDLAFVSPRTGRAVSRAAAGDWADRLLPLPPDLAGQGPITPASLAQGLAITAHFLTRELAQASQGENRTAGAPGLPEARGRLVDLLTRQGPAGA